CLSGCGRTTGAFERYCPVRRVLPKESSLVTRLRRRKSASTSIRRLIQTMTARGGSDLRPANLTAAPSPPPPPRRSLPQAGYTVKFRRRILPLRRAQLRFYNSETRSPPP